MVSSVQKQLQFASVEWMGDKFLFKELATFQNNDWGNLENWQFRAGHAFLQFQHLRWHSVIFDLDNPDQAPQITPLGDPEGETLAVMYQPPQITSQILTTPLKCHHMFFNSVFNGTSMCISSKVLTIEAKPLLKGFEY